MASHAKFLFDTVFNEPDAAGQAQPSYTAADLEEARQEGFARGVHEGRQAAFADIAGQTQHLLQRIADRTGDIAAALAGERKRMEAEGAAIALAAARCLATTLIAREPHAELEALFAEIIANLADAPHLAIRVPGGELAELRQKLEQIAFQAGFEGRVIVLEEGDMEAGDCRIEWADGGISRSRTELTKAVCAIIERRYGPSAVLPVESDAGSPRADAGASSCGPDPETARTGPSGDAS